MNRTQKKIIGWALVLIGVAMIAGVVMHVWSAWEEEDLNLIVDLLVNPLLYVGLIVAVAGVVVLKGDEKKR
jgi:archaellum biogenesis protein FlaJ (TadC family)